MRLFFGENKNNRRSGSSGKPVRIDHLHYINADEYECSVCSARFRKQCMVCPNCGARFQKSKVNDIEFIEEMELWDDDE